MSKEKLSNIRSLTFYKDDLTKARRTPAIPQLVCRGEPCKLFQPEAVRCTNVGGSGTEVDWNCQADLPEALRFGRVEVSCEGWSGPGDPYVLKGSCSLEYRLVQVHDALRTKSTPGWSRYTKSWDLPSLIFSILWFAFLIFISYNFFMSCFRQNSTSRGPRTPPPGSRPGFSSNSNSGSGWFPGSMGDDQPPPYSKYASGSEPQAQGWRPGFWTGAALGGLANHLWNGNQRGDRREWDWERPRASFFNTETTRPTTRRFSSDDRGEGPSNLGAMRRSTGMGGSNVR